MATPATATGARPRARTKVRPAACRPCVAYCARWAHADVSAPREPAAPTTCADTPCGAGSLSCTDNNVAIGDYTCACATGWYGKLCDQGCDDGYTIDDAFDPPRCVKVITDTADMSAQNSACGANGALVSILNAADNAAVQAACNTATSGGSCFGNRFSHRWCWPCCMWYAGSRASLSGLSRAA